MARISRDKGTPRAPAKSTPRPASSSSAQAHRSSPEERRSNAGRPPAQPSSSRVPGPAPTQVPLSPGAEQALALLEGLQLPEPVREALRELRQGIGENALAPAQQEQALRTFRAHFVEPLPAPASQEEAADWAQGPAPGQRLLSRAAQAELEASLGPAAATLHALYVDVQKLSYGEGSATQLESRLLHVLDALRKVGTQEGLTRLTPATLHLLNERVEALRPLFVQLEQGLGSGETWKAVRENFRTLVLELSSSRGVWLTPQRAAGSGWGPFRRMSEKERTFARLELEDPEAHALEQRRRQSYRDIQAGIASAIEANGMDARRARILGRVVQIGTDRVTGEERVFDLDGDVLPVNDFIEKRLRFLDARRRVAKAALCGRGRSLRALDDSHLRTLSGNVEYVALTDDQAKSEGLTRLLPTRWHEGRRVVVEGRFAGVYLDDLVNVNGRFTERTAFDFEPRLGRTRELARPELLAEPYVTLRTVKERGALKDKLYLQLPNQRGAWTQRRQALRKLSKLVPSVDYVEGSRNACFTFEAKDFALVRDTLEGMSLSTAALHHVRGYFEDLARAEQATAKENLRFFSAQAIGGFKTSVGNSAGEKQPFDLSVEQKQALAWLEANGNRGVCALDTGFGKTLVAVAQMQKLLRDGEALVPGSNGRFLYVCPPALRGNLTRELRKFLEPDAARNLQARIDVLSYGEFRLAQQRGQWKKQPFDASRYVSVFFDEAQAASQLASSTTRAALALKHPRKICLTASPMERSPMEAYVLASICNNVDLGHRVEGALHRAEMRKFRERFCETLGGRIIGVRKEPLTKRDLDTWVRRNVFFVDKLDAQGFELPGLKQVTETLVMSPELEHAYRAAVEQIRDALRGLVSVYRDKGQVPEGVQRRPRLRARDLNAVFSLTLRAALQRLNTLATLPELLVPGTGAPKLERAAELVSERLFRTPSSRTVLFAEDGRVVEACAQRLSERMPGSVHAACLADRILLFQDGAPLSSFAGHTLPFTQRAYPSSPEEGPTRHVRRAEWQHHVLSNVLAAHPDVTTVTLLGQSYQQGQNLQAFDTVVHLDRDSWNNEDMKQRTARVWRQGQHNPVSEFTLDLTYASPEDPLDRTLDEIRGYYQHVEGEVFDGIIKEAQATSLGREWLEETVERKTSSLHTSQNILELMLSPYLVRSAELSP